MLKRASLNKKFSGYNVKIAGDADHMLSALKKVIPDSGLSGLSVESIINKAKSLSSPMMERAAAGTAPYRFPIEDIIGAPKAIMERAPAGTAPFSFPIEDIIGRASSNPGLSGLSVESIINKAKSLSSPMMERAAAGTAPYRFPIEDIIGEEAAAGLGTIGRNVSADRFMEDPSIFGRLSGAGLGAGLGALGLSNIKALQRQDPGMLARLMGAKSRRGLSKNQLRALGAAMGGAAGGYLS